jgi:MFS family permease
MALVASQVPRERSGWALSTLSTAQISGVIGGPLLGGFLADHVGLRAVFIITAILLTVSFLVTLFLIKEGARPQVSKGGAAERQGGICLAALSGTGDQPVFHHSGDPTVQRLNRPDSGAVYQVDGAG